VMKAIFDSGLRVPEDISVTGFDDIEITQFLHPALTTMRQPVHELSRQALQTLYSIIEGLSKEQTVIRVAPSLVVRQSTAPPGD
ncbi:MAG: LacI family transcriptional regulator, partial [Chloroflexi bacterium]